MAKEDYPFSPRQKKITHSSQTYFKQPASVYPMEKERKIIFTSRFREDLSHWIKVNARGAEKVRQIVKAIERDSFKGIGKPEPLKGNLSGLWSRRLNQRDRIVYAVDDDRIIFIQCRYHY